MIKRQAKKFINQKHGEEIVTHLNCHFSNINHVIPVWWFTILRHKFDQDLHLLLCKAAGPGKVKLIHIKILANTFPDLEKIFSIRPDTIRVDLQISSIPGEGFLHNYRLDGTQYDFRQHVYAEYTIDESDFTETHSAK